MRNRRPTPWVVVYFLEGCACLLVAGVMAAGAHRVIHLVPVLVLGAPGAVLVCRAPVFGVRFGPSGVRYSGLLGSRSYLWADIREVRPAVLPSTVYSSDVPELVLVSGGTDQLLMLGGHSWGRARNRRVVRLVAELEAARAAQL
ncbi:hypothetical protein [Streptomyces sp. NPDC094049]|uniref:hypothetical protein n=1 Tax=Streptomyces sp. NPDC094049 TaxID=3154987 RepID=UPI003318C44D